MKEIWKDIPSYEGKYQASNSGKIRSLDRVIFNKGCNGRQHINGKILAISVAKNGYCVVNLGHGKQQYVHRLICNTFIGKIPYKMTVNHKDGNKTNNNIKNLEILSYQENHLHAYRVLHRKPTCLGKLNTNASKAVYQYNGDKIIATYPSAREAERRTGVSYKHISLCCKGERKTTGGYRWSFK